MSLIMTLPDRLAKMLVDCNENVIEAYHLHQDDLDYIERPSWIISDRGADYSVSDETSANQAAVEENYELALVGEPYKGTEQDYNAFYELQTRQIAFDAIVYLLRHPNLQFSNQRGLAPERLPNLLGVFHARPTSRSEVTIMTREGLEQPFWGFTISIQVKTLLPVDEDEIVVIR